MLLLPHWSNPKGHSVVILLPRFYCTTCKCMRALTDRPTEWTNRLPVCLYSQWLHNIKQKLRIWQRSNGGKVDGLCFLLLHDGLDGKIERGVSIKCHKTLVNLSVTFGLHITSGKTFVHPVHPVCLSDKPHSTSWGYLVLCPCGASALLTFISMTSARWALLVELPLDLPLSMSLTA